MRSASRTQTLLPCSRSARLPGRCVCSSHTRSRLQSKSTALFCWAPNYNILTQCQGHKWGVTSTKAWNGEAEAGGKASRWDGGVKNIPLCVSINRGTHQAICFMSWVLALWRTVKIFGWPDLLKAINLDYVEKQDTQREEKNNYLNLRQWLICGPKKKKKGFNLSCFCQRK